MEGFWRAILRLIGRRQFKILKQYIEKFDSFGDDGFKIYAAVTTETSESFPSSLSRRKMDNPYQYIRRPLLSQKRARLPNSVRNITNVQLAGIPILFINER